MKTKRILAICLYLIVCIALAFIGYCCVDCIFMPKDTPCGICGESLGVRRGGSGAWYSKTDHSELHCRSYYYVKQYEAGLANLSKRRNAARPASSTEFFDAIDAKWKDACNDK